MELLVYPAIYYLWKRKGLTEETANLTTPARLEGPQVTESC